MKLTQRDIEILRFIAEFGFCEIRHIEIKFGIKKSRCYQIMQRLTKADLVVHEKIFYAQSGVFYLSKLGASTCSDLPYLKNIPKDNYQHQLTIIDVYFKLMQLYPEASWISERRIYQEKSTYCTNYSKKDVTHLADGVLMFPDDRHVAIEVELSMKTKKRIEDIIFSYALHNQLKEVWYFCSPAIINRVRRAAGDWTHIKVYALD
jgi:hypothetical protein